MLPLKCRGVLALNVVSMLSCTLSYASYLPTWELSLVLALQRLPEVTGKGAFQRWRQAQVPNPYHNARDKANHVSQCQMRILFFLHSIGFIHILERFCYLDSR